MKYRSFCVSILIFSLAGAGVTLMHLLQDEEPAQAHGIHPLPVLVREPVKTSRPYTVHAFGSIEPARAVSVTTATEGTVIRVSPKLKVGGLFSRQETILELDPTQYRAAVSEAKAALARARHRLAREELLAEQARTDIRELGEHAPSALALRLPQLEEARADELAARDAVSKAEENLRQTTIRAPFAGMIQSKSVEFGQFVDVGTTVATLCELSRPEIRLPLTMEQTQYLRLVPGDLPPELQWPVCLLHDNATVATARLMRTEGSLDQRSRTLTVVARLEPLAAGRQHVWPGLFVQAMITGPLLEDIIPVPEDALTVDNRMATVTPDKTIRPVIVTVVHRTQGEVWVRADSRLSAPYCAPVPTPLVSGVTVEPIPAATAANPVDSQQ